MADINDISDVQTQATNGDTQNTPTTLPIRGEKRILPVPINPGTMSDQFEQDYAASGLDSPEDSGYYTDRTNLVEEDDFYIVAALAPYTDFVTIRILNRGRGANGDSDPTTNATFWFLINPAQVQINRTTLDTQAMVRSGWQFGVWGEDSVQISINGKTAGQYWAFGTTDRYRQYSQSYRNLEQLQIVFENNGYWFEGEQTSEGPLAADFARRRIKMHQDVELTVGNFVWYGMFESLEITQDASTPFLMDFNFTFIAWKERFRLTSPYQNQIMTNIQRGNSYSAYATATTQLPDQIASDLPVSSTTPPQLGDVVGLAPPATPNVNPNSPAVAAATPASNATPTNVPTSTTPAGPSVSTLNTPPPYTPPEFMGGGG